ncbi:MAG: ABC transporter permease [Alphaproteobacteria bacterium]|nr:ABC transporter permease [Alphaproteobacteria bacterium]
MRAAWPAGGPRAGMSLGRVLAMLARYYYLFRGSVPRIIELAYWPIVQVALWGFITKFFLEHSSWLVNAAGALLAGVLLWDVLFRGQLGLSISFLEEMWARNLGQLFASPLRPGELMAAMMLGSLIRTSLGLMPATLVAWLLHEYSIYSLGLPLIAFFANLMVFGWAIGLAVCALLIRYGLAAESFAWASIFILAPLSAVYYPVDVLPEAAQAVALALPSAHVFEGMRAVMIEGVFRTDLFLWAIALNVAYIAGGVALFAYAFNIARRRGLILQSGE